MKCMSSDEHFVDWSDDTNNESEWHRLYDEYTDSKDDESQNFDHIDRLYGLNDGDGHIDERCIEDCIESMLRENFVYFDRQHQMSICISDFYIYNSETAIEIKSRPRASSMSRAIGQCMMYSNLYDEVSNTVIISLEDSYKLDHKKEDLYSFIKYCCEHNNICYYQIEEYSFLGDHGCRFNKMFGPDSPFDDIVGEIE